jgi:hypothetical protein
MGCLQVTAFEQVNRRTRFDKQQDLRRLLDRGEIADGLLNGVIKQVKIFAAQAFHEVSGRIGDDHADIDAVHADVNALVLRWWRFLRARRRDYAEQRGE